MREMEPVHTETYKGFDIKIYQDTDYNETPEESGDGSLFLTTFNRRECWVTKTCKEVFGTDDPNDVRAKLDKQKKYDIFPVRGYSHSGIGLSLNANRYPFNCPWDSGWWGFVAVEKKFWKTAKERLEAAESLIQEWNDHLSGNIWGYVIEDEDGEDKDSCWGFVGDYAYCVEDAKGQVDAYVKANEAEKCQALDAHEKGV